MAVSANDGPLHVYGLMAALAAGYGSPVPDPDQDAGPSLFYQGTCIPDVRFPFLKDKVPGYTGVVPAHFSAPISAVVDQIPAATATANIAALQAAAIGVPMVLATVPATGVTPGIPIRPQASPFVLNNGPLTSVIALDYGFAFANCTAGQKQVVVADSSVFVPGMPLVIGGVGNSVQTAALLTLVASIDDATHVTLNDAPLATLATAPVGTGNQWGPSPQGFPYPDSAMPYFAVGPLLLLDPKQALARCISASGVTAGTGGNILIAGYDLYGQAQTELITVAAGANTVYGKKAFKYVVSATPQFTDATHNYSIGTGDTFGAAIRGDLFEYQRIFWEGLLDTGATASGWLAADTTSPATDATGDVRQTVQVSADGAGTGINGGSASDGTISGLAMIGYRLVWHVEMPLGLMRRATPSNPQPMYGVTPA